MLRLSENWELLVDNNHFLKNQNQNQKVNLILLSNCVRKYYYI